MPNPELFTVGGDTYEVFRPPDSAHWDLLDGGDCIFTFDFKPGPVHVRLVVEALRRGRNEGEQIGYARCQREWRNLIGAAPMKEAANG